MLTRTVLLLALSVLSCGGQSKARRPDVVVIMLDTTRADHLSPFNENAPTPTPFMDRLAERSVVFENAWTAATFTGPSIASMFTGLYPPRHGLESNILGRANPKRSGQTAPEFLASVDLIALPRSVQTLTEHLHDAGYQTIGIGANPNFCRELGFARGFDSFERGVDWDAVEMASQLRKYTSTLTDDRPTFTYLHYMDAHAPYHSRSPWCAHGGGERDACSSTCRYKSEISFMDSELDKLFNEMGWLENGHTIVVLVTDHGEEFGDHGGIMHRFSVHQELSRSGLMVFAPGLEAKRVQLPAHHTDLLPTILALVDLPPPDVRDGVALCPPFADGLKSDRELLTCRKDYLSGRDLYALTSGDWRLILELPRRVFKLYNIAEDPLEKTNLVKERRVVFKEMRMRLDQILAEMKPVPLEHVQVDLTDRLNDELSHLGYVEGK